MHLKQAMQEESKGLLYPQDSSTLMQEMITQQSGEWLRVLAGQVRDAACKYADTNLKKSIKSRFKHSLADPETRKQLIWDDTDMALDWMI